MYWRICATLSLMSMQPLFAQRDTQLWLDYQLDYPFSNEYLFEVVGSYQEVISGGNRWRNFVVTPTFEAYKFNRLDLIANLPIAYTAQKDTVNSFEIDPTIGARYNFTQNKRVDTKLTFKYEQRYFHRQEQNDWEISNRTRLKAEAWISITGPNLFTDKLLYAILDYEEFFVLDKQVNERFANRRRGRIGLGYRFDYSHRVELIYTRQSSRNEIDGAFLSDDNVIQFRYKMYINPSKPNQTTP